MFCFLRWFLTFQPKIIDYLLRLKLLKATSTPKKEKGEKTKNCQETRLQLLLLRYF